MAIGYRGEKGNDTHQLGMIGLKWGVLANLRHSLTAPSVINQHAGASTHGWLFHLQSLCNLSEQLPIRIFTGQ